LLFGPLLRAAGSVERPLFPTEMDFKATGSGFFQDPGAKKAGYPANFSRRAVAGAAAAADAAAVGSAPLCRDGA